MIGVKGRKSNTAKAEGVGIRLERACEMHGDLISTMRTFPSAPPLAARRRYEDLLADSVQQYVLEKSKEDGADSSQMWNGEVTPKAREELQVTEEQCDLGEAAKNLCWWSVGSRMDDVDASWTLSQIERVQEALQKGLYSGEEMDELLHSLTLYIYNQLRRLKSLQSSFPPKSSERSINQLALTLRCIRSLEEHSETRRLLDQAGHPLLPDDVTAAVTRHTHNRWSSILQVTEEETTTPAGPLPRASRVASTLPSLLREDFAFYEEVFQKEMNMSYTEKSFSALAGQLGEFLQPVFQHLASIKDTCNDISTETSANDFSEGSHIWILYQSLAQLYSAKKSLSGSDPKSTKNEMSDCLGKLAPAVGSWLTLKRRRSHRVLTEVITQDDLIPVASPRGHHSPSFDKLIHLFDEMKTWWSALEWPEPETRGVLLVMVVETLTSLTIHYCNQLTALRTHTVYDQKDSHNFLNSKFCSVVANLGCATQQLGRVWEDLGVSALMKEMQRQEKFGAAQQLGDTVKTLVTSVVDDVDAVSVRFMEESISNIEATVRTSVTGACEQGCQTPLIDFVLGPTISLLRRHLLQTSCQENARRFLRLLWEEIISAFMVTVADSPQRKPESYFKSVREVLVSSSTRLMTEGGISSEVIATPGYKSLLEQVELHSETTSSLIRQYYYSRHHEQTQGLLPTIAHILIRAFFSQPGRLTVRVLQVRDVTGTERDQSPCVPAQCHVRVQVVPFQDFPHAIVCKTWTAANYPAIFNETFDFPTDVRHIGGGFLQLTLMKGSGRGSTFLGETFLPLAAVPYMDSPNLQNVCLRLTAPCFNPGYRCLRILATRTEDEMATSFSKAITKQHLDGGGRKLCFHPCL